MDDNERPEPAISDDPVEIARARVAAATQITASIATIKSLLHIFPWVTSVKLREKIASLDEPVEALRQQAIVQFYDAFGRTLVTQPE